MKFSIIFLLSTLISYKAFAHGEDKPGPNNGFIRMPGTFHTELVPETDGNFRVYLFDVNNKNPAVKDSSVEFKVKDGKSVVSFKCLPMDDHFLCANEKKITDFKKAQIVIKAKRLGVKGTEAVYDFPLTSVKPEVDHSKLHH